MQILERYHILPFAGGWLDQPPHWRRDMLAMMAIENDVPENLANWFGQSYTQPKRQSKDEQTLKTQYERFGRGGG